MMPPSTCAIRLPVAKMAGEMRQRFRFERQDRSAVSRSSTRHCNGPRLRKAVLVLSMPVQQLRIASTNVKIKI